MEQTEKVEALLQRVFNQPATAETPYHSARTGDQQLIFALRSVDGKPGKAFGFTVANAGISAMVQRASDSGPLLPPSLADGQLGNDLLKPQTPLTQIRMFAEALLLGRTRTDEESRRSLQIIDRESRRLSHLVNNILRFSNISDTTQIDQHWQPLAPIVKEVCGTMQATTNGVVIQIEADSSVQANVDADALRQVLLNLLDNAVKYGPQQQQVSVVVKASDDGSQISIADQDPGIPAAERERVWSAFYRLKREQDTAISGNGIGLCVVRELIEAMDGRCWIDSLDGGARVNIEFPIAGHA